MWRFLRNRRLILRLHYYLGTHILGASRGGPCDSTALVTLSHCLVPLVITSLVMLCLGYFFTWRRAGFLLLLCRYCKSLSTLATTVAEFGDSRRIRQQLPKHKHSMLGFFLSKQPWNRQLQRRVGTVTWHCVWLQIKVEVRLQDVSGMWGGCEQ